MDWKTIDIKYKELMHEIELFSSFAFFNVSNAFLVIEGYGRDERDFANRSEEIFEWFRSIMNFSVSYRSTPYIMWPRKPLSFIKESPLLLIFNEKKEYITLKYRLNVIKERNKF